MVSKGFPNVIASGRQYNIGEKPSVILFFSILQMVSHVFMADVGHSGQILSYADSAWSCVGNDMPCLLCC